MELLDKKSMHGTSLDVAKSLQSECANLRSYTKYIHITRNI